MENVPVATDDRREGQEPAKCRFDGAPYIATLPLRALHRAPNGQNPTPTTSARKSMTPEEQLHNGSTDEARYRTGQAAALAGSRRYPICRVIEGT